MDEPTPASCSMKTSWPLRTSSCTPAGVMATRYSWFLTSRGMPTFTDIQSSRPARPAVAADLVVGARESRTMPRTGGWEGGRMKLYADRPDRVVRQLMGDVLVLLLVYASIRLGMAAHDRVAALADPG